MARSLISIAVAGLLLVTTGCDTATTRVIPEPETVGHEAVPYPEGGKSVYYDLPHVEPNHELEDLIDAGFDIEVYWLPRRPSPCMAATAQEVSIVQLERPDKRIRDFGFEDDPGQWILNCGVDSFLEYDFNE